MKLPERVKTHVGWMPQGAEIGMVEGLKAALQLRLLWKMSVDSSFLCDSFLSFCQWKLKYLRYKKYLFIHIVFILFLRNILNFLKCLDYTHENLPHIS